MLDLPSLDDILPKNVSYLAYERDLLLKLLHVKSGAVWQNLVTDLEAECWNNVLSRRMRTHTTRILAFLYDSFRPAPLPDTRRFRSMLCALDQLLLPHCTLVLTVDGHYALWVPEIRECLAEVMPQAYAAKRIFVNAMDTMPQMGGLLRDDAEAFFQRTYGDYIMTPDN